MTFTWWRVEDGVAVPYAETLDIIRRVNSGERGWYGSVEGTIIHGGVLATAFSRKTEKTYDSRAWLERGERIHVGEVTTTTITAKPKEG